MFEDRDQGLHNFPQEKCRRHYLSLAHCHCKNSWVITNGAKRDEAQTIPADLEEIIRLRLHCWGFVFNIAIVNRHSHSVMREIDFDSFEIASFTVNVLMILCKLKEA